MLNRVRGSDETYTGLCNDMLCFGGKGTLMDGIIGENTIKWVAYFRKMY